MKHFKYENATSFDEVKDIVSASEGKSVVMAGGTDLLGVLKGKLLPEYPETVVSLKEVPDTEYIKEEGDVYKIGAMTTLSTIERDEVLKEALPAVGQVARSVASPLIRNRATIGGNLCQDVRCWFYRYPDIAGGILNCARKGGHECYAIRGDNRYHSVFGGMKTGLTPCSTECPAGTDIPGYMAKFREGDIEGAATILMQYNPLPMMTSRVCAHTCQTKCNRCTTDENVSIHSVERVLGDYIMEHLDTFYPAPKSETGKTVVVVGGGPAGLTAAYYLRKAGNAVTVVDANEEAGGCLMYAIPNFRLPKKYVKKIVKALETMGIKFQTNTKVGEAVAIEDLEKEYDKVFVATGAWARPVLGFDGEEFTEFGLQFLVEVNKWINKKTRKHVLVVGGGNVSMDVAITAKRLGAESVTLACLEQRWEMPASEEEVGRAIEEGVTVMNGYGPARAIIEDGKIKGMELKVCTSVRDETGRFNPSYDESQLVTIEADSVLMAAGQRVDLSFLKEELDIAINRGLIKVEDESQKTSRPNFFAGGDAVTGPTTVIKGIRSGRNAAEAINREFGIENPPKYHQEGFLRFASGCAKKKIAVKDLQLPAEERTIDKEDSMTLSVEVAREEANRCMNCGCYSVNASDLSPVMVMLGATLKTTEKEVKAADFFTTHLKAYDMLDEGEVITEIQIPKLDGYKMSYQKFRMRDSLDFAMASMASAYKLTDGKIEDVRIVMGAVAPIPLRMTAVEELLIGKAPSEALAEEAGNLAIEGAESMGHNDYKINEVKTYVKRLVEEMMA